MPLQDYMGLDPSQMTEEELMQLQNPQVTDMADMADYAMPAQQAEQAPMPAQAKREPIQFDKSGVNALQDYIQNLGAQKQSIDYTPLAAYLDSTFGGNLTAAAKEMRGMNKEEKALKMGQLQNELAQRKNELNKNEVSARNSEAQLANAQALMGVRKQGVDNQAARIGNVQDKIAADIGNKFDNDQILRKIDTQKQQIALDKHTLESATVLTPQIFNEIQMGLANAISGGRTAAVSTQNKMEFDSAALQLKRIQQRLNNKPEDIGSPEVKKNISDTFDRLQEAYNNNSYERAKQIEKGRALGYRHNPDAVKVMKEKVESYRPPAGVPTAHDQETGALPSQHANGPQPGDIEGSHKFKGGDPADPSNWVPLDQEL